MRAGIYLVIILLVAFIIRSYNLANNPPAAYGDEISFAWNAWNILKTGGDEYGTVLPLQFRAFDDYKAPLPVYLLVPFIWVLGLTTFAIRLPVVILSVATIYVTFLLAKKVINEKVGLLSALLLTVSPWHMHLSRGFFESTIALFFFVTGVYFFVLAKVKTKYLWLCAIAFALCVYSYFTPRIFLIFFIPFLFWWGKGWTINNRKNVVYFIIFLVLLCLPLIKASVFDKGLSRIDKLADSRNEYLTKQVIEARNSSNSPELIKIVLHNRPFYWTRAVINDYLEHFSLNFWYVHGDSSLRYFLGNMGMFYLVEMPFILLGIYLVLTKRRQIFLLLLGWLLLAPIPAAIAGKPFAVRSLAMLPGPFFFVGVGLAESWKYLNRLSFSHSLVKVLIILLFSLSLSYYLIRYHLEYPTYAATWWGWENKAAIDLALKEEPNYDYIFISNFYSGVELAVAYYTQYDPFEYRLAKANKVSVADKDSMIKFGKFYIGSLDVDQKRYLENIIPPKSLYIGRPEEFESTEVIVAPVDNRVLFNVYRTQ